MANALVDLLDAGAGPGTCEIRTGAPPASITDPDSGTLLATLTFSDPAFGNAASGVATASGTPKQATAVASGDAGHYRAKDSDGNVVFDGTAGEAADAADVTFDEKTIVAGGTVSLSSMTVTQPAS